MNRLLSLSGVNLDYSLFTIIINIILSSLLGLSLALIYKRTHKGLSYSQSFTTMLVLITTAGAILMMVVGNSLARAFSLFGAFSIIRFRTAIKDTRDMAFVFMNLIIGMAVGTNNYLLAVLSTLGLGGLSLSLSKYNFGSTHDFDYLLTFYCRHSNIKTSSRQYLKLFTKFLKNHQLINLRSLEKDKLTQLNFNIKLIDANQQTNFLSALKKIKGLNRTQLLNIKDDIEY